MSAEPILFIIGSGDESDRVAQTGAMQISVAGASDLHKLLLEREPYELLHVSRNFFRQTRERRLLHYRVLVNLITEAEQSSRTLDNLRKLLRGVPGKIINPPEAVLRSTRDRVARMLSGIPGLIVPKAARLRGDKPALAARMLDTAGIKPPIILRQAGTHGGKIIGCFDSVDATVAALVAGEHVATEFIDFRSADGLYRKYRMFFIGPHTILRHMLVSDSWNVHASARSIFMASRPELVAEERSLFETEDDPLATNVRQVLDEVHRKMALDFFGMDFGVTQDGKVVLFEANATMSFFPFSSDPQYDYLRRCFAPAQAAFRELLGLPSQAGPALSISLQSA